MNTRTRLRIIAGSSALLCALSPITALAAGAGTSNGEFAELVHDRHENFEDMGAAFKVIRDALRSGEALDMAALSDAADVMVGFAPQIPEWFPAGSGPQDGYETDALAYIWRNNEKFASLAADMVPATEALKVAVASGEQGAIVEQFSALGKNCKGCHDSFRAD